MKTRPTWALGQTHRLGDVFAAYRCFDVGPHDVDGTLEHTAAAITGAAEPAYIRSQSDDPVTVQVLLDFMGDLRTVILCDEVKHEVEDGNPADTSGTLSIDFEPAIGD